MRTMAERIKYQGARLRYWGRTHRPAVLVLIIIIFAGGLSVYDPPGVENYINGLNTDTAEAGPQWKYKCRLPTGIEKDISGRWGTSSWQSSENKAMRVAIGNAARNRYTAEGPDWVDGTFTLYDSEGVEAYIVPVNCYEADYRYVKDKKKKKR
jgi:hypothetical protein